jgi:hypothetical protein
LTLKTKTTGTDAFLRFSYTRHDPRIGEDDVVSAKTYATTFLDGVIITSGLSAVGRYALPVPLPAEFVFILLPPARTDVHFGAAVALKPIFLRNLPTQFDALGFRHTNQRLMLHCSSYFSLEIADSRSQNAVSFSSARKTKRFPSSRCASAIQIVRPLESMAATQPQFQPALLRLSVALLIVPRH